MTSLNALRMFKQGADEEKAEVARLSSFVGAMAIGDLVKSTLGPKVRANHGYTKHLFMTNAKKPKWNKLVISQGMDKILWGMGNGSGTVEVTNDGATILRSVGVDNPAAKVPDLSTFTLDVLDIH